MLRKPFLFILTVLLIVFLSRSGAVAQEPASEVTNAPPEAELTGKTDNENWRTKGNKGTDPSKNFLGTRDAQALVFRTNKAEAMRIDAEGNVGIGTTTPNEQLEITGNFRLPASTAGLMTGIIFSGADLYIHHFGDRNFFAGVNAGNLTMTGFANTAVGQAALRANFGGIGNTAVGVRALAGNTAGTYNTAVGEEALVFNTIGAANTAVGEEALMFNTRGSGNTAVGHTALRDNTGGRNNTAVGVGADVSLCGL